MRAAAAFVVAALASSLSLVPRRASADCETLRPTDPGGYFSDDFAAYGPTFFDSTSGRLRIHYATSGPSAPTPTPPNQVPDLVVLAAEIGDEALAVYDDFGFSPIRSDAGPGGCPSNGGDGRIDLYFVSFGAGDGQSVIEECAADVASACSGYVLCEVDPAGYPSQEIALRTIVPHELFHLIQASYNGNMPSWFQEGTAQWAADRVHPALTDLEHFVPAYVQQAHRSIDNPPGGAAAAFLYGTAVWPVFLDESFGLPAVRGIFEGFERGLKVWEAIDGSLAAFGSSSADAFPRFAVALAGVGDRYGTEGFLDGEKYEALPVEPVTLGPGTVVSDVLSGFAIRSFEIGEASIPHQLSLEAPQGRVAAYLLPLEAGLARVDKSVMLPATVSAPALVVVAGTSPSKQDAPFAVTATEAPPDAPAPATSTSTGAGGVTAEQDGPEAAGCSTGRSRTDRDGAWLVVVVASLMWRRNMTSLYEQYADLKAKGSKLHPRDAARSLRGTEAELVASMPHARRLGGTPQALVRALGTLGDAKTMTRNELAIIEKWGRFEEIEADDGAMMGQVVGEDIDLRLFFSHWLSWFLVEEPGGDSVRTSLQVFDERGDSAFKVFAESEESRKALVALADSVGPAPATPLVAAGAEPERKPSGDQKADVEAFWAEWDAMQNTHEFFGLLRRHGVTRVRGLELAGPSRAREVEPNALELLLEKAAGAEQPIMVFVGSRGVIQIHTGPVHTIKRMGGYLNVLDRGFNLHVKDEGITRAFVVRKPTADGDVTSLELYDADGETVALLFSKRKPGQIEVEPWREMLRALPGRGQS